MSTSKWMWIGIGLVAALGLASCAPVDPPTLKEDVVVDPGPHDPPEQLDIKPEPAPSGPRYRIEAAIENVRERDLLTTNGFWTIFHGILGLGPSVTLLNPETKARVNAIQYICDGGEIRGLQFNQTKHGLDVQIGPMMVGQGHQDQFVAEMAQWGMQGDQTFIVQGKEFTFMDFIRHSKARARLTANQELSWTILIMAQFYGTECSWTNGFGEKLRLADLLRYELDAPMDKAPCGGTHRLFGLTWVYHMHLNQGGHKVGIWKDILDKTVQHRDLAKRYQNPDGSFSTNFFKEPGNAQDKVLRINTTGHTLEWLALALPDDQLKAPWVENAANALALMILDLQGAAIEGGSLYHAVHGLLIYHSRVYKSRLVDADDLLPLPPPGALDK